MKFLRRVLQIDSYSQRERVSEIIKLKENFANLKSRFKHYKICICGFTGANKYGKFLNNWV